MTGVALVTGGQRGIGLGIAKALQSSGHAIAILAEKPADHPEVTQALAELGPNTTYRQHDLRQAESAHAALEAVEDRLGPVTTFVSNAGVPSPVRGDMLDIRPENFDFVMDVNLRGGFFLAQDMAQRMQKRSSGVYQSMIFVTSVSAEMVSVERAEYCLSKAAASMMSKLFAARLAADSIGVYELRPGIIETDMTAGVREKYDALIADGLVPARRWGQAADIGAVTQAIASGQMAFATGAVIPVDGGLSIQRL